MSSERPDFDRMRELVRELEEMCREAASLRGRLMGAARGAIWPERRIADVLAPADVSAPARRYTDDPRH